MPLHYRTTIACVALLALLGCWLTDDVFTRLAIAAGAVGVAVVLADLHTQPRRVDDADTGSINMSFYTARRGARLFPLLAYLAEHPGAVITSDQAAAVMGCEVKQVRSLCAGLAVRGLLQLPLDDMSALHVRLGDGVTVTVDVSEVTAWSSELSQDEESMPPVQRRISAADAAPMIVSAPRSVFELGGRAHG